MNVGDKRVKTVKETLTSKSNPGGTKLSTQGGSGMLAPKDTVHTGGGSFTSKSGLTTHVVNLENGSTKLQLHSHDGKNWHQVPMNKPRVKGDQVPLSPRSNTIMSDFFSDL